MAALKLKKVSLEKASNMKAHRTNSYNSSNLILRRGQEFKVKLYFNRSIQKGDMVEFVASTGPAPEESLTVFQLSGSKNGKTWTAVIDSSSSAEVTAAIKTSSRALVGPYKMNIYISSKNKKSYFKLEDIILLFNPWAKDDVVYMKDENERLEYVLNDSGIIYYGLEDYIKEIRWNYGQFEEGILDTCFQILNRSLNYQEDKVLDCSKRYHPGYVGRVVSAMINSFDDEGVLEGSWSTKFSGGVHPGDWNGSVDILNMWRKGSYKPVKYGQCWVFAGVMCTVLRCLGIPTRVITNFASAHDKDSNLTVDSVYTKKGKSMSEDTLCYDVTVPRCLSGSEKERSIYLKARKKLIAMGILSKDSTEKRGIGKKRRKKRPGFEDLDEVKEAFHIQGRFELNSSTRFGDDIQLTLHLKNTSNQSQPLKVKLSSSTIEYIGRPVSEVYSDNATLNVPPKKEKRLALRIPASDYEPELTSHNLMEVVALCELKNKKKMLVRKVVAIEQPPLDIQIYSQAFVSKPVDVEVTYTNPLSTVLKDGVLVFGGGGLVNKKIKRMVNKLDPKQSDRLTVEITPYQSGNRQLTVDFTSKHFTTIKGFHKIKVVGEGEVREDSGAHEEMEVHEESTADEEGVEEEEGEEYEEGDEYEEDETYEDSV
ncbi:protein-glutamine gamma-glutamyltransferase E-like [Dendrobates tinctorius]|uniref:protein-glutamine gamma-glutamyltransferase E-like n=1 Tax=Dendrobates tinctorius TaxID=92724 RepID=UPI003CCA6495